MSAEEPFYPRTLLTWATHRRLRVPSDVLGWVRTNPGAGTALEQGLPWLNLELVGLLRSRLRRAPQRVLEWGSGGSTVFFAEHAEHVVTVEHDQAWCDLVSVELQRRGLANVDLRHVPQDPPGHRGTGEAVAPLRAAKLDAWDSYLRAPGDAAEYDLVLVDGKARLECLARTPDLLRPGGLVVVDDTDKPGRLDDARRVLPEEQWTHRLTVGPGPASGPRLLTTALVLQRRPGAAGR